MRWSDYSSSGSTTTFKGQVNWKPIPDLRFRAGWSEGFRAPTIGELFGTPSRFDQELDDAVRRLRRCKLWAPAHPLPGPIFLTGLNLRRFRPM